MAEARDATRTRGPTPFGYPDRFAFVRHGAYPVYDNEGGAGAPQVANPPPVVAAPAAPVVANVPAPVPAPVDNVPANPPALALVPTVAQVGAAEVAAAAAPASSGQPDATMVDTIEVATAASVMLPSSDGSPPSGVASGPDAQTLNNFLREAGVPNPSAGSWDQALAQLRGHMASLQPATVAPAAAVVSTVVDSAPTPTAAPAAAPSVGAVANPAPTVPTESAAEPSPMVVDEATPAPAVAEPSPALPAVGPVPVTPLPAAAVAVGSASGSAVTPGNVSSDDSVDCAAVEQLSAQPPRWEDRDLRNAVAHWEDRVKAAKRQDSDKA